MGVWDDGLVWLLDWVALDGLMNPAEKKQLREYRRKHHISDREHQQCLDGINWSIDEYHDGCKHGKHALA